MKRIELEPGLFVIKEFVSSQECDDLVIWAEQQGFEEAKVQIDGSDVMLKGVRNNSRILFEDADLANRLWERLKPFVISEFDNRKATGLNELFRFYKYEQDQRFKKHRDGSYIRNENEASYFTFMIYLNDDFEGGETSFENHLVKPEKGMALVFHHPMKHAGEAIKSGIKYALRSDIMYKLEES